VNGMDEQFNIRAFELFLFNMRNSDNIYTNYMNYDTSDTNQK